MDTTVSANGMNWYRPSAHIRLTSDVTAGFASEMTLADVTAVSAAVETWLRDVLAAEEVP